MVRTLAVLAFIAGVGAAAGYVAHKRTLAHGDVLAADLMEANKARLSSLTCDDEVDIGVDGARFACRAVALDGSTGRIEFAMDRAGNIRPVAPGEHEHRADVDDKVNASDPWGN
jgi:hypothetical protein